MSDGIIERKQRFMEVYPWEGFATNIFTISITHECEPMTANRDC